MADKKNPGSHATPGLGGVTGHDVFTRKIYEAMLLTNFASFDLRLAAKFL
jgi:hypothetical protein